MYQHSFPGRRVSPKKAFTSCDCHHHLCNSLPVDLVSWYISTMGPLPGPEKEYTIGILADELFRTLFVS
jgi:hypothetical protein